MKTRVAIFFALLALACVCVWSRYSIVSGGAMIYRLDRWTGKAWITRIGPRDVRWEPIKE